MKNPANKKRRPPSARRNHTFPDTLGKVPIEVRSLRCVGGVRPGPYSKGGRGSRGKGGRSRMYIPQSAGTGFSFLGGLASQIAAALLQLVARRGPR